MNELEILRDKIDKVDKKLLPLFLERMQLCEEVAEYKRKVNKPVLDREREKQVLSNKMSLLEDDNMKAEVYEFFESLMTISRVRQTKLLSDTSGYCKGVLKSLKERVKNPKIVYFGSEGAYSEEAAINFFGKESDRFYAETFEEVFEAIEKEEADYAVLPIENSSTGTILDVADLLFKYGYYIVGEIYVPIRHCLMGIKGAKISDIKTVYSHEQGLLQSREFLKSLDAECEAYLSTALSAKAVADSGDISKAAVASKKNAEIYGLSILKEEINSSSQNTTRFVVISKTFEITEKSQKISAVFTLKHESGQLYRVLSGFSRAGLNLLKLESRPIPESPFEYRFFVDYTGNILDDNIASVTDNIVAEVEDFKLLGNFENGVVV